MVLRRAMRRRPGISPRSVGVAAAAGGVATIATEAPRRRDEDDGIWPLVAALARAADLAATTSLGSGLVPKRLSTDGTMNASQKLWSRVWWFVWWVRMRRKAGGNGTPVNARARTQGQRLRSLLSRVRASSSVAYECGQCSAPPRRARRR
eukprot:6378409-Prymnesium_polylepis.2